jgi:hypothetical protein
MEPTKIAVKRWAVDRTRVDRPELRDPAEIILSHARSTIIEHKKTPLNGVVRLSFWAVKPDI